MAKSKTLPPSKWRYLSWSQLWLWENKPADFIRQYIYGEWGEPNQYMLLGKKVAECLENQDAKGDPMLEHLLMFMQGFESHEHKISCNFEGVPLYMKLDGFTTTGLILDEVKTGLKYTQKTADTNDQLTFYAIGIWKKYGKLPETIRLHWAQTHWNENNELELTGKIETFETTRTMTDIINFTPRILKAWKDINEAAAKEYKTAIR